MSLWSRLFNRTTKEPKQPQEQRIPAIVRTLAGVAVTPDTAVTVPAVWACLRYLSQTVAVLPWRVMQDTPKGGQLAPRHNIDYLLHKRPNPEWSAFQFRETLTHWALRWGNGYAEIERDSVGRPIALWPIHPERVCVERDPVTQALYYEVRNEHAAKVRIESKDMFHIRGFGEGPVGVNVIEYAAQSIGWARAAQLFGAAFFGNGANLSGVVTMKQGLTDDGFARLKAQFDQIYKGVRNANKTAFLDAEMDYKSIGVEPEKAQFLETNQHLVEEICRWFGVPPHKVMHLLRATFSNIEHQAIEVVVDSVSPWVKRFEEEADYKLFGQNRLGYYTKMNMNALMRGDAKSRGEFYQLMFNVGAFSPNDILRLEDMNTLGTEGDKHLVQLNLTTLDKAGEQPMEMPGASPPDNDNGNDNADEVAAMAHIRTLEAAHV